MNLHKRVTIKQVAEEAGVSAQTVSRVLNDRQDVSQETRKRVLEIIERTGYSPNIIAQSLIRGRSFTLGVVGHGLTYYGPSRILMGIERRSAELGYSLLLSLLRNPDADAGEDILRTLIGRQVDGIVWAAPEIGGNRAWVHELLGRFSIPVVFINMQPVAGVSVVSTDNFSGAQLAVRHLLGQGYQRIGLITGPSSWWESRQREAGWRLALSEAGVSDLDPLIVAGDWSAASGEAALQRLLQQAPDLEAVFCCNDPMALGALSAAKRLQRPAPHGLAIMGYDNTPEGQYFDPPLTTVRQRLREVGAMAVELLNDMLTNNQPAQNLIVQPELIVRSSTLRNPS